MKMMFVVALALVAAAAAAPQGFPVSVSASAGAPAKPEVKILRSTFEQEPDGPYVFGFEADNGIKRDETAVLKEVVDDENKPHQVLAVRGEYSHIDEAGNVQTVTYYADETGFHVKNGDTVPSR